MNMKIGIMVMMMIFFLINNEQGVEERYISTDTRNYFR